MMQKVRFSKLENGSKYFYGRFGLLAGWLDTKIDDLIAYFLYSSSCRTKTKTCWSFEKGILNEFRRVS